MNTIALSKDKTNAAELGDLIMLLLRQGYDCRVCEDDFHYLIDFDYGAHLGYGNPVLRWVSDED